MENITKSVISAEVAYSSIINYATQQNKVPVIRRIILENKSLEGLNDLHLEITSSPKFAEAYTQNIDLINPSQHLDIGKIDLEIDPQTLAELSEKIYGFIILSICDKEGEIYKKKFPVEVLPFDQWNGLNVLPEMLVAYVTPNNPIIADLLIKASKILNTWTGDPAFTGYQSRNPDRVKKQMAAIYEAIASQEIIYNNPPASFEEEGQRIRLIDTIITQKLATCLDMTLLYAACLEAVSLHPLLIVIKGHAFSGAWLVEENFADTINDDVSFLKKRTATGINEIALVETTLMNAGKFTPFDQAMSKAEYHLNDESRFILFVDVKRSRLSGIRPLPQRTRTAEGWVIAHTDTADQGLEMPEEILPQTLNLTNDSNISKQQMWERKLLDLSLRNNLLNLRVTLNTVQLVSNNIAGFEDAMANGDEFQLLPKPDEIATVKTTSGLFQSIHQADPHSELIDHELKQKRLRTFLSTTELSKSLTKLYRSSRLSLEETGANTLFIALGFLKWYETERSEVPRYAPILLLPVEMIRKSAQKGYVIRSREEETILNISLFEMLRQDFGISISGLNELPTDESGIDVSKVLNIIRSQLKSQKRWDVDPIAFLGIFSFSKFVMWHDIHNNSDKLAQNKIVASLMSGKREFELDNEEHQSFNFDKEFHPADLATPIIADASQYAAIIAAMQNKSFILHGPPGTGKSQTITNMIANALYQGKRVLFVAEKMAALSVVQTRLEKLGLAPFCLELHSNKSKKSAVLEQLQRSTDIVKKTSPLEYKAEADRINELRQDLNYYAAALHQKHESGFSLYECFSSYAELNDAPDSVILDDEFIQKMNSELFSKSSELIDELELLGAASGHPHNHPLTGIRTTEYNRQKRIEVADLLANHKEILKRHKKHQESLAAIFQLQEIQTRQQNHKLLNLAQLLIKAVEWSQHLLKASNLEQLLQPLRTITEQGKRRDKIKKDLLTDFKEGLLQTDAEYLLNTWTEGENKWFLPRWLSKRNVFKSLKPFKKHPKLDKANIPLTLKSVITYQKLQSFLDDQKTFMTDLLAHQWNNSIANWNWINNACDELEQLHHLSIILNRDALRLKKFRLNLADLLSEGKKTFLELHGDSLNNFISSKKQLTESETQITALLSVNFDGFLTGDMAWIDFWESKTDDWLQNLDQLREWSAFYNHREQAINAGLHPVIDAYENGSLQNNEVSGAFKKAFFKQCAENIILKSETLSTFNSAIFENNIKRFNERNNYFEQLTIAELYAKLASNFPLISQEASSSSEIGILLRTIRSRGRGMSIRKLFDLIENLLPRLCPCMLMSPLSVAQYIDLDSNKFDIVIFDEASQMPTSESIGAIARADNLIVVGDPKQMPPTSFFSSTNFDEENAEKEDLESVLDDCLALRLPSYYLLWHYRSKHESLIAFSNANFYENKLYTFPSPDDLASKVTNVHVPGYYDKGRSRTNRFEAKAIVEEVIYRLKNPATADFSIGIVTFSSVQQNLIEDMLNEALPRYPKLEAKVFQSDEPVFIKNLENVQGDERDVILFSVGYGPDKEGNISLNFGPLNREGGWRRLNVAITRARYEMKVFSTLRSEQIDISRTASEGIAAIKAFLQYSEKGKYALSAQIRHGQPTKNALLNQVQKALENNGLLIHSNIGSSGFRIDLAIADPDKQDSYILGILTDGPNYHNVKSARDRELSQPAVLKMLGWNIYRLWSVEWWDNPEKTVRSIINHYNELRRLNQENTPPDEITVSEESLSSTPSQIRASEGHAETEHPVVMQPLANSITQEIIIEETNKSTYVPCVLESVDHLTSDNFISGQYNKTIIKQINAIVEAEAPISKNLLAKRLLAAWGIGRFGRRIDDHLSSILSRMPLNITMQNQIPFYWLPDQSLESFQIFRLPGDDDAGKRNAEDLPIQEIAWAAHHALTIQFSLPRADLIRETARLFGFARIGNNVEEICSRGIDHALSINLIAVQNEKMIVAGNASADMSIQRKE